jgi:hypothetical protein
MAADEAGDCSAAAATVDLEALGEHALHVFAVVDGFGGWAVFQDVGIAVRKDDDITWLQRHAFAVVHTGGGAAFREQVKDDDVAAGREIGRHRDGGRRTKAPGSGKLTVVEHRAVELDRLQDFREDIQTQIPFQPEFRQITADAGTSDDIVPPEWARKPDARTSGTSGVPA